MKLAPTDKPHRMMLCAFSRLRTLAATIAITLLAIGQGLPASANEFAEHLDEIYYHEEDFSDAKHRLDLFIPQNQPTVATMLWIHGGAWAFGDRLNDRELARAFAREGIAVASMSYRLSRGDWRGKAFPSTGVQHPEHIKDVARAFAWLHENAESFGLEQGNLFVSGFSAGGHLSALLAMDERYLTAHELSVSHIRGVIPVAGGYDLENYYEAIETGLGEDVAIGHVLGVFGPREGLAEASPVSYLEDASVPMLVLTEGETADYTRVFENAVIEAGKTDLIRFSYNDEETHASLLASLSAEDSLSRDEIVKFILAMTERQD